MTAVTIDNAVPVVFNEDSDTSAAVALNGEIRGVVPGSGLANCDLTLLGSLDGETFFSVIDAEGEVVTLAGMSASKMAILPEGALPRLNSVKLKSSVQQNGDPTPIVCYLIIQ